MSIENPTQREEEARKEAEKILRFKIGPQYNLGAPQKEDDGTLIFPVEIRLPRVIFNETRSLPVDVSYMESRQVGEVSVASSGETNYTHPQSIYSNVREVEQEIQRAVEKALISAAAKDFTKLPFPENRYAPVEDLLGKVILEGEIPIEDISSLETSKEDDKYTKYLPDLEDSELLRRSDGKLIEGDLLANFKREEDRHSEVLNTALAHYFREQINNLGDLHGALGPYLAIAGFYYRLAIQANELPVIKEDELRDAFKHHYQGQGKQSKKKQFKIDRYLLHLERAGILTCHTESNERFWSGDEDLLDELEEETEYIGTITGISTAES